MCPSLTHLTHLLSPWCVHGAAWCASDCSSARARRPATRQARCADRRRRVFTCEPRAASPRALRRPAARRGARCVACALLAHRGARRVPGGHRQLGRAVLGLSLSPARATHRSRASRRMPSRPTLASVMPLTDATHVIRVVMLLPSRGGRAGRWAVGAGSCVCVRGRLPCGQHRRHNLSHGLASLLQSIVCAANQHERYKCATTACADVNATTAGGLRRMRARAQLGGSDAFPARCCRRLAVRWCRTCQRLLLPLRSWVRGIRHLL